MRKNKFWILFGLVILLSLGSQLLGQVNRLLTLSPTAQEASLGNQSLTFRNPARNYFYNDSTINLSFTRVDWLRNITDDMGYNYISTAWKKFTFSLLHFDYGMQNHTDDTGIILGNFRPSSIVAYVGWGTALKYKVNKIENISIGFCSKIINNKLYINNLSTVSKETITLKIEGSTGIPFGKLYGGQWAFFPWNQNDAAGLIEVLPSKAGIDIEYVWIHENVDILADD